MSKILRIKVIACYGFTIFRIFDFHVSAAKFIMRCVTNNGCAIISFLYLIVHYNTYLTVSIRILAPLHAGHQCGSKAHVPQSKQYCNRCNSLHMNKDRLEVTGLYSSAASGSKPFQLWYFLITAAVVALYLIKLNQLSRPVAGFILKFTRNSSCQYAIL